jgi:hypothetical protein
MYNMRTTFYFLLSAHVVFSNPLSNLVHRNDDAQHEDAVKLSKREGECGIFTAFLKEQIDSNDQDAIEKMESFFKDFVKNDDTQPLIKMHTPRKTISGWGDLYLDAAGKTAVENDDRIKYTACDQLVHHRVITDREDGWGKRKSADLPLESKRHLEYQLPKRAPAGLTWKAQENAPKDLVLDSLPK